MNIDMKGAAILAVAAAGIAAGAYTLGKQQGGEKKAAAAKAREEAMKKLKGETVEKPAPGDKSVSVMSEDERQEKSVNSEQDIAELTEEAKKAAKAKAESDVLLGVMGVTSDYLDQIIEEKLKIVGGILSEQEEFPIVAYSYYEYADNLKDDNTYSSLLYAEYALELADLGSYVGFQKEELDKDTQSRIIVVILILLILAASIWYIEKK